MEVIKTRPLPRTLNPVWQEDALQLQLRSIELSPSAMGLDWCFAKEHTLEGVVHGDQLKFT
eukprot:2282694-Amphidinium_carterae.1